MGGYKTGSTLLICSTQYGRTDERTDGLRTLCLLLPGLAGWRHKTWMSMVRCSNSR